MDFEQLIKLLPQENLDFISAETKVDHQVKKLSGLVVFKLILYSMLSSQKLSLRIMESYVSSAQFKQLSGNDFTTKYNSIRDRICTINASYFEQLFSQIFTSYNAFLKEEKALVKADSTYVSIAAKLVNWSMNVIDLSLNQKGKIKLCEDIEVYLGGKNDIKTTRTYRIIKGWINDGKSRSFLSS
ncbi:MAG: DUF4372 domain-containing protein [Flavobacteriales bacterium]